jgi:carbonic anhydrase
MKRNVPVLLILSLTALIPLAKAAPATGAADGVAPKAALSELVDGNKRFVAGKSKHPGENLALLKKLASEQKPHSIILSCSDSRVPPELVFDQGMGRLFTVRVAGNIVDPATMASIEYAVEHLGTRLIVVMGHDSCGAVKAALSTPPGASAGSKDLDLLVAAIRPAVSQFKLSPDDKTILAPVKANVESVAKELVTRSKIVRESVESKKVAIVPAIYNLEKGGVEFWDTP